MDESQLINDGRMMGLEGPQLLSYVDARRDRESKKRIEDLEREDRRLAREDSRLEREDQTRQAELEIRRLELQSSSASSSTASSERGVVSHEQKANIKLAQYKDGEDVSTYLRNFERVKTANGWSENVALSALINGFSGSKVSTFIDSVPDLVYIELKPLLIQSFGATIYDLQAKFRYAKQSSESISQFVLLLNDYVIKMCTLANIQDDFQKLKEFVIKDQLLRSVDKSLADFLKENDIFRTCLDDIVQLAENYQAIHGKAVRRANISQPSISNVKNSASTSSKPNSSFGATRSCFSCGKTGHLSRFCPVKSVNYVSAEGEEKNPRACYTCGDLNHFSRACPKKRGYYNRNKGETTEAKNAEMVGISLSGNGKMVDKSSLPLAKGSCNGKSVTVLRDTGATIVAVRPSIVNEGDYIDQVVKIKFADGIFKTVPKVMVDLKCLYLNGRIEVAIIEGLAFDVLVGNVTDARCACTKVEDERVQSEFEYCNDFDVLWKPELRLKMIGYRLVLPTGV